MLTRVRYLSILAIILMGLVSAVGCSKLPTQPSAADVSGAAPTVMIDVLPDGQPADPGPSAEDLAVVSASSRVTIHAGDFSVVIPARAFSGNATITVTQPDVTKPVVELSIFPPSKNDFREPVTLIANTTKADGSTCLSWYDPTTFTWMPVEGSAPQGQTVQAPLTHFSTYRVESNGSFSW